MSVENLLDLESQNEIVDIWLTDVQLKSTFISYRMTVGYNDFTTTLLEIYII